MGRGGRAFPLWADRAAAEPNIKQAFLKVLEAAFGTQVTASEVLAYIAAVAAHPAYTERFRLDLVQPGLRIPIPAEQVLFPTRRSNLATN